MTEKYLVTGASGFVGSFLVKELLNQGKQVRAMVRSTSSIEELKGLNCEIVEADVKDMASLLKATEGISGVFHIAALFRQAGLPDSEYHAVNVQGTRNVLEAAIHSGVRRVVHCSTVGVISHVAEPPADEATPCNPSDVYQESKMEGELLALEYFKSEKIRGVVIRPAMIYGPGDARTLKLFKMIARRRFFYVGRGESLVHWIDVRDLARAFCRAMQLEERNAEVYIIAGKRSLTLREMAEIVASQLGVPAPFLCLPVRPMQLLGSMCEAICAPFKLTPPIFRRRVDFFTKNRCFDTRKAKEQLGFEPAQDLTTEIADIIASYRRKKLI